MKTTGLFLCLALAVCSAASAAELLWQDFDSAPTGSVAALPGWTRAAWLGGITARVDNINYSHSPSNILEMTWNATASSAVYTNFNSTYNPSNEHPVIRCSAKLVTINTNAYFLLGLRNSATGARLTFEGTNGYGTFGFLYRDSIFIPLVNDRFVDVTFFYNRSNNHYRLDYDFTNRLAWATNSESGVRVTNFNQFVVARPGGTASTTDSFLVDDVSVETFPPHVWAWWRCDSTRQLVEQLGAFIPTSAYASAILPGASDPAWDGAADVHNEGAGRGFYSSPANGALALPASASWTAEAVFLLPPGSGNASLLDWGKAQGFDTNGAYINLGWNASTAAFYYHLRDSQQADANNEWSSTAGAFVPDGRWHHFAFVKAASAVSVYLDYVQITNFSLSTGYADGDYAFNSQFHASIGQTLNNGNASGPDTLIDEIRVSGKALPLADFIQPGQPLVASIGNSATNSLWHIAIKSILGKSYRVETSPSIGTNANWQFATNIIRAGGVFASFNLPSTAPSNFVRVIRTD